MYANNISSKDEVTQLLTSKLNTIFPELMGDHITQIGTTFHTYGSTECCFKDIVTLGSCDAIEGSIVEICDTEKHLLLQWRDLSYAYQKLHKKAIRRSC